MSKSYEIRIIDSMDESRKLWKLFSPETTLYDNWTFRECFHSLSSRPAFYCAFEAGEPIGILPLSRSDNDTLEFFGGDYMEDNRAFVAPGCEDCINQLYHSLPSGTELSNISDSPEAVTDLVADGYKYESSLRSVSSADQYVELNFSGKSKNTIRRQLRHVREGITVEHSKTGSIEMMMDLNQKSFGTESYFAEEGHREYFRSLSRTALDMSYVTLKAGDRTLAVAFSIIWKNVYYLINSGSAKDEAPNVGKLLMFETIEAAVKQGAVAYDAGYEDLGWKERWHFARKPQYKFIKL